MNKAAHTARAGAVREAGSRSVCSDCGGRASPGRTRCLKCWKDHRGIDPDTRYWVVDTRTPREILKATRTRIRRRRPFVLLDLH